MAPKISICIPTYNRSHFLREAIEFARSQTTPDEFEILVVDNASTDDTPAVIASFQNDPRLRYERNAENLGMVANFNRCLELARGDYITTWSDDDIYYPNLIAEQSAALDADPEVGLVYCAHKVTDITGKSLYEIYPFKDAHLWAGLKELKFLSRNCYFNQPLLRRHHLMLVGTFNPQVKYAFDWEMWLRFTWVGKIAYINKPLLGFRLHNQQASLTPLRSGFNLSQDWCAALESAFSYAPVQKYFQELLVKGYSEVAQRHLLHVIDLIRSGNILEAKRQFQDTHYALAKAGWQFVPYCVQDAFHFFRKWRDGKLNYLFLEENNS